MKWQRVIIIIIIGRQLNVNRLRVNGKGVLLNVMRTDIIIVAFITSTLII